METVKIFWKLDCPKCSSAKRLGGILKEEGVEVIGYNLDTVDGLAEGAYYSVMATPTMIVEDSDENFIADFRGIVPTPEEIRRQICQYFQ